MGEKAPNHAAAAAAAAGAAADDEGISSQDLRSPDPYKIQNPSAPQNTLRRNTPQILSRNQNRKSTKNEIGMFFGIFSALPFWRRRFKLPFGAQKVFCRRQLQAKTLCKDRLACTNSQDFFSISPNLQFPNAVVLNPVGRANERKRAQKSANASPQKSTKGRKRCKRALPSKNCK